MIKLVLIVSNGSIQSEWVQHELRRARRAELAQQRRKLFPICLIDFQALQEWKCFDSHTRTDLAEEVRQYFIPDFTRWKEHDAFEEAFARLLRDLKAVDTPPAPAPAQIPPKAGGQPAPAHDQALNDPAAVAALKRRRLQLLEERGHKKAIACRTGF